MKYQKYTVDTKFHEFIECMYSWEGYVEKEITIESPPNALTAIVKNYGDPVFLSNPINIRKRLPDLYFSGQSTKSFQLHLSGKINMMGIVFKPTGLYNYFGLDMISTLDQRIPAQPYLSDDMNNLFTQEEGSKIDSRLYSLREFMTLLDQKEAKSNSEITRVSNQIFNERGNSPINELIEETCLSRRTFERKFIKEVGVSPKHYAKLRRFGYTCSIMAGSDEVVLTDVLYHAGYYDQSHFIKDFKYFTGKTPKLYNETNSELIHFVKDTFYRNLRD